MKYLNVGMGYPESASRLIFFFFAYLSSDAASSENENRDYEPVDGIVRNLPPIVAPDNRWI